MPKVIKVLKDSSKAQVATLFAIITAFGTQFDYKVPASVLTVVCIWLVVQGAVDFAKAWNSNADV